MKKLDSNNNAATQTTSSARRRSTTARRSGTSTARRSGTTRRASASKKGSGYNKYVPIFIDNYAEQRSAKLRAKLGWQAYGIYLAILQRLRSEKDCTLELDYESLALSFWTDEDNLRAIIEDFNLFAINRQEGTFYSPLLDSMLSTLDPSLAQSRAPLCLDPVEEEVCEMTEEEDDFSDKNIEDSVGESDFSDENSSVSDEKLDVTEKEFRVKEKKLRFSLLSLLKNQQRGEWQTKCPFLHQKRLKNVFHRMKKMMQNLMHQTLKMLPKMMRNLRQNLMPKMMQNLMQKTVQEVMQKVCCKCAQMWCKTMRCKVMQMNTLTRFLTRA